MPKNPSKVSDFADPSLASRRIAASTTRPHQGAFFLPFSFLSLHPFPLSLSLSHPVPSKTPYIPRLFSSHLISFHPLPSFSIYIAGRVDPPILAPEPTTYALLGLSAIGLLIRRRTAKVA